MINYLKTTKNKDYNAIIFDYYFENNELKDLFDTVKFKDEYPKFRDKLYLCSSLFWETDIDYLFKEKIEKNEKKISQFIKNLQLL